MYHFLSLLLLCIFVSNFFTWPLLQQDYPSFLATLATPSAPSQIMPSLCQNHPSYSMTRWSLTKATIVHTRKWKSRLKTCPGQPPPYSEVNAKSMCFWESRRTTNDGISMICLPTLKWDSETSIRKGGLHKSIRTECVAAWWEHEHDEWISPNRSWTPGSAAVSLQEILNLQHQHVTEPHASLVQHTNTNQTTDEHVTLKQSFRIFGIEFQELTSGTVGTTHWKG